MQDPQLDPNNPQYNPALLGPGGTEQNAPAASITPATGAGSSKDTSGLMILSILALITSLGTLNGYLKTVSSTLLNADLQQDNNYAALLSGIHLQTPRPGTSHKYMNQKISVYNQRQMMYQQVLQARLKTHQNQEQIDIQAASTTTSNMQQLASMLSSMIDLLGQVFQSVNTINR